MDTLGSNSAQFPQLVHELSHHNNTTMISSCHSPFMVNHPSDHQELPCTFGKNNQTSPGQMDESPSVHTLSKDSSHVFFTFEMGNVNVGVHFLQFWEFANA